MTWTTWRRRAAAALMLLVPFVAPGCGLLDVTDPTKINEEDLANATGADLMRREALARMYKSVSPAALYSGLFADEFFYDTRASDRVIGRVVTDEQFDRRDALQMIEGDATLTAYRLRHDARVGATDALEWLRKYGAPEAKRAHMGQMFLTRGYVVLGFAEDYCAGMPLNEIVDGRKMIYGPPLSTNELFERALSDFDSAVVYAADSARIADAARITRGRALLGLGRFAEAAEAVGPVTSTYVWNAEFTTSFSQANTFLFFGRFGDRTRSVSDREGGNGLDFVSANDPRVKLTLLGAAVDTTAIKGIYAMAKYPNEAAPIVLASGIEARLIEAEAALHGGGGNWLSILNTLRTNGTFTTQPNAANPALTDTLWNAGTGRVAGLRPLEDPGTADARVDLLFRERAFWLFGTGHRLGDLRRLVRHYGRAPESIFPAGTYHSGGSFGTATSLPFPAKEEAFHNPAITGCTE